MLRWASISAKFSRARPLRRDSSGSISLNDLLGRPAVNLSTPELQRFLAAKRVLVTGAGGSIGSEICRQTMKFCPSRLLMVERAENALFEIDRELRHTWLGADVRPLVADVCDRTRVEQIFRDERPQVVFHCAAHKHVPMMEANPGEAIKNNVFGVKIVADAARSSATQAFVLISTDKAVNPSSVMGATKRFAELYVQSLNDSPTVVHGRSERPTRFVAVRFGNVIGSSGSVLPIFQKQIEAGGPVTVTHPEMKRYFMTIPEASQLVMQAGAIGRGGEIFVLDMGEEIRIVDLAHELITRNGFVAGRDIAVRFTGVRPGEKLREELAGVDEQTSPTSHPKIHVWKLNPPNRERLTQDLKRLADAANADDATAVDTLQQCVAEYRPDRSSTPTLRIVREDDETPLAA